MPNRATSTPTAVQVGTRRASTMQAKGSKAASMIMSAASKAPAKPPCSRNPA